MKCPGCGVELMASMQVCPKCRYDTRTADGGEAYRARMVSAEEAERRAREERERAQAEEYAKRIRSLKDRHYEGYWEYKVLSLIDGDSGAIMPDRLETAINDLGLDGWRLRCSYANEVGRNSSSTGVYGVSNGTNATIDQNILIFERFVPLTD